MKTKEELISILDDFIQYKDYFENPPQEAYLVDGMDYSRCREAREIEKLLYKYKIYDTRYPEKLPDMERKYGVREIADFSRQKLTWEEVLVILTWLHRAERHAGGFFLEAIENGTFYRLLCRMEEIKEEMISS